MRTHPRDSRTRSGLQFLPEESTPAPSTEAANSDVANSDAANSAAATVTSEVAATGAEPVKIEAGDESTSAAEETPVITVEAQLAAAQAQLAVAQAQLAAVKDELTAVSLEKARLQLDLDTHAATLTSAKAEIQRLQTTLVNLRDVPVWEASWPSNRVFVAAPTLEEAIAKTRHAYPDVELSKVQTAGIKLVI